MSPQRRECLMGAERKYDRDEWVPKICTRLADGDPLAVICREMGIPRRTVNQWRQDDAEIDTLFLEARDDGHDMISYRSRKTIRGKGPEEGGESTGDVVRDKAIVEHDLKLLAKWDPRRYGDKQQVELSGGIDVKKIERVIVDPANPNAKGIRPAS
jgi:hypothetical protein